jgi:SHS2 domain-containing protein
MYEIFPHTADLGLRVKAATHAGVYTEAASGLMSMIVANLESVRPVTTKTIEVVEDEADLMLFDWLNELLYLVHAERLLLSEFDVTVADGKLNAKCSGEPIDPERHQLDHDVKAITYHELKVRITNDGWLAEVIVDI